MPPLFVRDPREEEGPLIWWPGICVVAGVRCDDAREEEGAVAHYRDLREEERALRLLTGRCLALRSCSCGDTREEEGVAALSGPQGRRRGPEEKLLAVVGRAVGNGA